MRSAIEKAPFLSVHVVCIFRSIHYIII